MRPWKYLKRYVSRPPFFVVCVSLLLEKKRLGKFLQGGVLSYHPSVMRYHPSVIWYHPCCRSCAKAYNCIRNIFSLSLPPSPPLPSLPPASLPCATVGRPVKAPSMLTTTFLKTTFDVYRGTPESGGWGGVPSTEGDIPHEGKPPRHLVFVVHGCGESLVSSERGVCT